MVLKEGNISHVLVLKNMVMYVYRCRMAATPV